MNLIVGLGNPGKEYENTRHNAGFMAVDELADSWKFSKKFKTEICRTYIEGQDVYLAKPQTFMNKSGEAVRELVGFLDVPLDRVWVVHDDLDLDLGKIRIRTTGSSGGHKGVESIINMLGTEEFPRFRVGIKTPRTDSLPADRFVLEKFSKEEQPIVKETAVKTAEEIKKALREGIEHTSV